MESCRPQPRRALARWKLHPEVIVTHRFAPKEVTTAYETFDSARTPEVAIVWDGA